MRNVGLVHFNEFDEEFFAKISKYVNVSIFSSSALFNFDYIKKDNVRSCINSYFPGCMVFNVDALNYISPSILIKNFSGAAAEDVSSVNILERFPYHRYLCQSVRLEAIEKYSVTDRLFLIRFQIMEIIKIIRLTQIEVLIFGGIPHSLADSIFSEVADLLRIPVYYLQDYSVTSGRSILYNKAFQIMRYDSRTMSDDDNQSLEFATDRLSTALAKAKSDCFYMPPTNVGMASDPWNKIYTKDKPLIKTIVDIDSCADNLDPARQEYLRFWISNCKSLDGIDLNKRRLAVFYLNLEPEAATNPGFPNRLFPLLQMIKVVRDKLPVDRWTLILKEHPAYFTPNVMNSSSPYHINRSVFFRECISAIEETFLVSPDITTNELLRKSSLSVVPTGTVTGESLALGVPVAGIEYNPFSTSPGFIQIDQLSESSIGLAAKELESISYSTLARNLISASWPGSPNSFLNPWGLTEGTNNIQLASTVTEIARIA